eukprot:1595304-Prymnesium_polylepis.1
MTGFRTITQSIDHSNNLYDRNVTRATWDNPACMGYWSYQTAAPTSATIPTEESKDSDQLLYFQFAEHGPIWLDPNMLELKKDCGLEVSTFA